MNSTGKFLVSALLVHAASMKKMGDTQTAIPVPQNVSSSANRPQPAPPSK